MTKRIDSVLADSVQRGDVPGVAGIAVTGDGVIYEAAFGKARVAEDIDMRTDTIFTIASMTKGITSLAAMQVVDRGKLALDDPVGNLHPGLAGISVLNDDFSLRPPAGPVTLRQLLTHTSGLGYEFSSKRLISALATLGIPQFDASGHPNVRIPLLFDPGERWQYGVSTDWAGILIQQATSRTLPEYMRDRVFEPLGMTDSAFGTSKAKAERGPTTHTRQEDGSLIEGKPRPPSTNRSGGGGMTATAADYARFLQFMLGDGTWNGKRLLSPEGMHGLCSDQVPGLVAGKIETGVPALSNDADFSEGGTAGHSLGFIYSREAGQTGRSASTLSWAGLFNTYYWIDRAKGVAGAIFFQILPFADELCLRTRREFETAVYDSADS